MIQNLSTYTGQWLTVNQSRSQPYISPGAVSAGMMRYNPTNNSVEVYDGNSWFTFSGHAEVNLTPDAQRVMEWATEKMIEERKLEQMMKDHPGLREAYERLEIMKQLCLEEEKSQTL